jgi:hypothetical protein
VQCPLSIVVLGVSPSGLSFVVFGTVAFSLVMSLLFLLTRGTDNLYDQIGQGGFSMESDPGDGLLGPVPESAAARTERELEIRQMLEARNERLVRQGQAPVDIDAELARLEQPNGLAGSGAASHNAALTEEVRQLVLARNERRARQGLDALDVETEVQRTLAELDP